MNFNDKFVPVLVEATNEQPAALVRIFLFRVPTDFVFLLRFERDHCE
jgi:hypothetical protein